RPRTIWRRRPDLNRGWRFCRFNGVLNRVVSRWSLVGPATPFCPVFGRYWTTSGLQPNLGGTSHRNAFGSAIGPNACYPASTFRGRPPRRPFVRELAALRWLVRLPTSAAAVTRLTFERARPRVGI